MCCRDVSETRGRPGRVFHRQRSLGPAERDYLVMTNIFSWVLIADVTQREDPRVVSIPRSAAYPDLPLSRATARERFCRA